MARPNCPASRTFAPLAQRCSQVVGTVPVVARGARVALGASASRVVFTGLQMAREKSHILDDSANNEYAKHAKARFICFVGGKFRRISNPKRIVAADKLAFDCTVGSGLSL